LAKPPRKSAQTPVVGAPRAVVHLKKEELQRVEVLKGNIMKRKGINNLDLESLLELIYLRILGRVKTRGPVESELKELKKMLDQAAAKTTEILKKSERSEASK
jgi:hypothetical protein